MAYFVIETGLTRRLIQAANDELARQKFLGILTAADLPKHERIFTPAPGEINIYPASEYEMFLFGQSLEEPADQIAFEGMEVD